MHGVTDTPSGRKTKAFSEISAAVLHGGHAPDCGCQPCRVVAAVVMAVLHERMEVLDAALRDLSSERLYTLKVVASDGRLHSDVGVVVQVVNRAAPAGDGVCP